MSSFTPPHREALTNDGRVCLTNHSRLCSVGCLEIFLSTCVCRAAAPRSCSVFPPPLPCFLSPFISPLLPSRFLSRVFSFTHALCCAPNLFILSWFLSNSAQILEYFSSLNMHILEVFGQSECSGPQTTCTTEAWKMGSVGRPMKASSVC